MSHEPPRYIVEHLDRRDQRWHFLGAHWKPEQAFGHLEHLRGQGLHVRVQHQRPQRVIDLVDLKPGDDWEGKPWQ